MHKFKIGDKVLIKLTCFKTGYSFAYGPIGNDPEVTLPGMISSMRNSNHIRVRWDIDRYVYIEYAFVKNELVYIMVCVEDGPVTYA